MRAMSKRQEKRLGKLLDLAGNDYQLFQDALMNAAHEKYAADLEDIIEYILERLPESDDK